MNVMKYNIKYFVHGNDSMFVEFVSIISNSLIKTLSKPSIQNNIISNYDMYLPERSLSKLL